MQLLILGGTIFLGRHLAQAALDRGHTVTLFNRGQHNPDLFPQVEKLRGSRDGDLEARYWSKDGYNYALVSREGDPRSEVLGRALAF